MENISYNLYWEGDNKMAVNDTVEIISSSEADLYGKIARVLEVKTYDDGTDIRILTNDGLDIWIDADDVVIY